jgi:GH15 family glucan-1,4-alpha-glucosidase
MPTNMRYDDRHHRMRLEDLGLVGNCQFSALIDRSGSVVWCCLPRFDSDPVFSTLLDHDRGGTFSIGPASGAIGEQRYLENTNVLETRFVDGTGSFRVIDFAPRFMVRDKAFRPTQLVRIVEPLEGAPRVRVRCAPKLGWSKADPQVVASADELSYEGFSGPLHLTADVPLAHVGGEDLLLQRRCHFVLTLGDPIDEPLWRLCARLLDETTRYWRRWVKHCNVPPLYQEEVIRSGLALKLHCYEETGAIIAAMTTSIPESPASGRTWDYRYCWLRDAYFSLGAFRLLGHFEERESFLHYLLGVAERHPNLDLAPLYRVDGTSDLEERTLDHWPGYGNHGPVRIGNAAAKHAQHDIFGEMVLALAPIYLDERYAPERTPQTLELLQRLTRRAIEVAGTPDAGIWEYRTEWQPQTFSSLMSWAAADRMSRIARRHSPAFATEFGAAATRLREDIMAKAWNPALGSLVGTYGGSDLDASLLQAATLRLLPAEDPRLAMTIDAIWSKLSSNGWLFRYRLDDGFGQPTVAFIICTFWLVEALATIGRRAEAKRVMDHVRSALSPLGLLSEDYETQNLRMWGNFPQAYSHVGLIRAAFAASPAWAEFL